LVIFTPQPLYPRYPFCRRLGGLQSRSGRSGDEKDRSPLPGIEPWPSSPSLHRLSYPASLHHVVCNFLIVSEISFMYFVEMLNPVCFYREFLSNISSVSNSSDVFIYFMVHPSVFEQFCLLGHNAV
jgi:hypothetical protein